MTPLGLDVIIGIVGGLVFLLVAVGLVLAFHEAGSAEP